ncbi:MAG: SAM-dependent methyltransferase, partial [Acidimicrobiales bacterium]
SVIWGSGSKGVSFLNNLGSEAHIGHAVDINPYKHGKFMAGTGQEIVAPEYLTAYQPQLVVAMNPIYVAEIQADLDRLGVAAELTAV